jgi:hypothetical protein
MSDADVVSVFARKMGAVERLMQRAHTDVQVPSSGEMKDIYTHISDLAAQIKREKYIEQLEAIESSTRNPQKVAQVMSLPLGSSSAASHPTQTYAARTLASPHFHSQIHSFMIHTIQYARSHFFIHTNHTDRQSSSRIHSRLPPHLH